MAPASRIVLAELQRRVEQLELRRELTQADVSAQLDRTLARLEDVVTSIESLRRRVDALERSHAAPRP